MTNLVDILLHTDFGTLSLILYWKHAPNTVSNFIKLVDRAFYNGLLFHRVVPDLFIQTGCPRGTGLGGPGYFLEDEFCSELSHREPGTVSMANFGPNTNGSQFFITVAPMPWLDSQHSIFGRVVSGLDVAQAISRVNRDQKDKPIEAVRLNSIEVIRRLNGGITHGAK